MTILNEVELNSLNDSRFADNVTGDILPVNHRAHNTDLLESLQAYGGVINDGVVASIEVSAAPIKWTHFTTNSTSPNLLLEADQVNSRVKVYEPGLYFVTLRFQGDWAANENLDFETYVNGASNPITPISVKQEGQGVGDPMFMSITRVAFVIPSSLIIDQGDGDYAAVDLWASSDTGTFDVNQQGVTFGLEYSPLSIRTVG